MRDFVKYICNECGSKAKAKDFESILAKNKLCDACITKAKNKLVKNKPIKIVKITHFN